MSNEKHLPSVLTNEHKVSVKVKQIEEMVDTLYEGILPLKETYGANELAAILYNAGYRKHSEWISVEDRLPTDRELVLVSSMDLFTKKHGWFYLARYTDLQNDGVRFDDKRWLSENGGIFGKVTHWMPLPEAPKMKGGE